MSISFKSYSCVAKEDDTSVMFPNRNGSVAYPECALYEVGGNIGEWDAAATFWNSADICVSFCSLS